MSDKIMIFIDGANIFNSIRDINYELQKENEKHPQNERKEDIKIDYIKLIKEISANREVIRTYLFEGVKEPIQPAKEAFFNALRQQGITVITRPLRERELNCVKCNLFRTLKEQNPNRDIFNKNDEGQLVIFQQEYQKGVDVALVTELLRMAREDVYGTAIVVSGDNDYKNAIECVKSMGKRVEVASFKRALGRDLKEVADKLIFLDNYLEKIRKII